MRSSTTERTQHKVISWLEGLVTQELIANAHECTDNTQNRSQKRKRSQYSGHYPWQPPSPPATFRTSSSRAANTSFEGFAELTDSTMQREGAELDQPGPSSLPSTPQKRKTTQDGDLEDTPRGQTTIAPPLSDMARSTTSSRSDQSRSLGQSRSERSSPIKRMRQFELESRGFTVETLNLIDTPSVDTEKKLMDDMAAVEGAYGIIAQSLKPTIEALKQQRADLQRFFPHVYQDCPPGDYDSTSCRSNSNPAETAADHRMLFDALDISRAALECQNWGLDESGWNQKVHSRMFDAAIQRWPFDDQVSWVPCMNASISPAYDHESKPSSRVDYALCLTPKPSSEEGYSQSSGKVVGERCNSTAAGTLETPREITVDRINALRRDLPDNSINHTSFRALWKQPVGISIETKRYDGGTGVEYAELQLGVWLRAQWRLLSDLAGQQGISQLPFLPAIVVCGHSWKLVLSKRAGRERTSLLVGSDFGSTQSVLGTMQVLAGLRVLMEWMVTTFRDWYRTFVVNRRQKAAVPLGLETTGDQ